MAATEQAPPPDTRGGVRTVDLSGIPRIQDSAALQVQSIFKKFLSDEYSLGYAQEYVPQLLRIAEGTEHTITIRFEHLEEYSRHLLRNTGALVSATIREQYYRFAPYLQRAVAECAAEAAAEAGIVGIDARDMNVDLAFANLPQVERLREFRMGEIAQLTSFSGTVTRTSEVRPELVQGSFICQVCGQHVRDVEQEFKYTEPSMCPQLSCNNTKAWKLDIAASRFADWQKVRVQENASEIPTGSMPRSIDVILRNDMVEKPKAGDKCIFTGMYIVVPDVSMLGLPGITAQMMRDTQGQSRSLRDGTSGVSGLKATGVKDLSYRTSFLANNVQNVDVLEAAEDKVPETPLDIVRDAYTPEELTHLLSLSENARRRKLYNDLVSSVAPAVFGHGAIKKGVLLQLMGGVHKQTNEGTHLRGDLNVCIVGDPSTSKSQFLKYVTSFSPRSVYTSGKASSAAGLTAAVMKDEETGNFTIEAGALMLADNGICAIDEFDKMDISDQIAIHEAMEQQTISIAKAGIQATLNARTSILAAANPVGGRYNKKQDLRANVALSSPIMSRFDLFFVVLDEYNEQTDRALAEHIVNLHTHQNDAIHVRFSTDQLQRYVRYAKTINPKPTRDAMNHLVRLYGDLRSKESTYKRGSYKVTVRQLESLIRLSEAIARAHLSAVVTTEYVSEAYALLTTSIIQVERDAIDLNLDLDDVDLGELEDFAANPFSESSSHAPSTPTRHAAAALSTPNPAQASDVGSSQTHASGKIPYDEFVRISTILRQRVREVEAAQAEDIAAADEPGVSEAQLVSWFVAQDFAVPSLTAMGPAQLRHALARIIRHMVHKQDLFAMAGDAEGRVMSNPAVD